jgi:hypothetical protein
MNTAVKEKIICPRCGKNALSDHGEPYCLTHGPISEAPVSEPIPDRINKRRIEAP